MGNVIRWVSEQHGHGGQHTNGPDYGTLVIENEVLGVKVEVQTRPRLTQAKARDLGLLLMELAVLEIGQ